jgi:hypothetical protein
MKLKERLAKEAHLNWVNHYATVLSRTPTEAELRNIGRRPYLDGYKAGFEAAKELALKAYYSFELTEALGEEEVE